jgi:hypothetical protein
MDLQRLLEAGLQSPVLVVLITGLFALVGGQWLIRSKDEQLKTKEDQINTLKEAHAAELKVKDERIAALERWMPTNALDQLEAMKKLFQMEIDETKAHSERLSAKLEVTSISAEEERLKLEVMIRDYQDELQKLTQRLQAAQDIERALVILKTSYMPSSIADQGVIRSPVADLIQSWVSGRSPLEWSGEQSPMEWIDAQVVANVLEAKQQLEAQKEQDSTTEDDPNSRT